MLRATSIVGFIAVLALVLTPEHSLAARVKDRWNVNNRQIVFREFGPRANMSDGSSYVTIRFKNNVTNAKLNMKVVQLSPFGRTESTVVETYLGRPGETLDLVFHVHKGQSPRIVVWWCVAEY